MATETKTKRLDSPSVAGIIPYRLSARQFGKMADADILPANGRVELLDGLLVDKRPGRATPILRGLPIYPLMITQFIRMMDVGIFTERSRVELLGGVLARRMTKNTPHNFTILQLGETFRTLAGPEWIISEEKSVELRENWRPEPDIALLRGPDDRYRVNGPTERDIPLVIEVADSTKAKDRGAKRLGYAAAGIPVYWLVDLSKRVVEVYTMPSGRGQSAKYRESVMYKADAEIPVVIEGREVGMIAVKDILP
jgi:Uma2 family endonuclease